MRTPSSPCMRVWQFSFCYVLCSSFACKSTCFHRNISGPTFWHRRVVLCCWSWSCGPSYRYQFSRTLTSIAKPHTRRHRSKQNSKCRQLLCKMSIKLCSKGFDTILVLMTLENVSVHASSLTSSSTMLVDVRVYCWAWCERMHSDNILHFTTDMFKHHLVGSRKGWTLHCCW